MRTTIPSRDFGINLVAAVFGLLLIFSQIIYGPQPALAQQILSYNSDPAEYSLGFARAHWSEIHGKAIIFFGNSHNPFGDNSIRAFDPVANTWEYLWGNSKGAQGLQNRDNHGSLYVPSLDELWVWTGSGLENWPGGAWRSGRFSLSQRKWITTSPVDNGAFSDVVQDFLGGLINSAMAWSSVANSGLIFGGSDGGNPSNRYWIIEPNQGGQRPYKMSEVIGGVRPPPRAQASNLLVAVGADFYLLGGYVGNDTTGAWTYVNDFWRFRTASRTWEQLVSPPTAGYQATLNFDSDKNVLLAKVFDGLYAYHLDTEQWEILSVNGLPCVFNEISVYSPPEKVHLFKGGNRCSDTASPGPRVYGVKLGASTSTNAIPTPNNVSRSTQIVSAPPSTLRATFLGATGEDKVGPNNQTTPNGKADFHITVSGLRGKPNKVRVTSVTGGIWETPFNGQNWIIAIQYDGQGNGHYWFEPDGSKNFHVKVTYPDATTDETDASNQTSTLPSVAPLPPPPPPPPPPSNPPAQSSLTSEIWLNIPMRTWVSRPYAPAQLEARNQAIGQRGYGHGIGKGGGAKHQRVVYNPDNKRVYFYSGDFFTPPFTSSYRADMFSFDITRSTTTDTTDYQNWILEWPYCGLPGQVSPTNTDEAPFAWDSKRHVFWITGGWELGGQNAVTRCNNGALFYGNDSIAQPTHGPDILQFDPAKNRYIRPDSKFKLPISALDQNSLSIIGSSQMPRHSIYNPVTDEIIMIGYGRCGTNVMRLNAETGAWTTDCDKGGNSSVAGDALDGSYINDTNPIHEQLALDVEHQWIYWIDPFHKQNSDPNKRFRLMRYDITKHSMTSLGWIPLPWNTGQPNFCTTTSNNGCNTFPFYHAPNDSTMLAYDPINRVVLWPASSNEGRPILMIYHPDPAGGKSGSWEVDPMTRDKPNEIIFGSNGTFIPELNALLIYGGYGNPNSDYLAAVCPSCNAPQNYFWLYRYGNGDGKPYVPPQPLVTPPPPPPPPPAIVTPPPASTLKAVDLGVTGEDKVGQVNQTTPNGKADFHITVSGLRGLPNKVTITSDTGGIWETPFNGLHWIIATQYDGQGNGHYWFEQFTSKNFRVKVGYADGTSDAADVASQNSQNAPGVKFSQPNLTFVTQLVGSPKVLQTVTLTNSGSAALDITGIASTGDFTQSSNCPSALSSGAQCVISVAFQPLVPGLRTGFLTVTDNAPGSPHIVNLTGTAAPVAIDTTPPTVAITAPLASALLSKTVTVTLGANDNVGVAKIELYKDGALLGTGTSSIYKYDWDTNKDSNGNHTLIAVAYDMANNRSTATVTINVQNTAATVAKPPVLGRRF